MALSTLKTGQKTLVVTKQGNPLTNVRVELHWSDKGPKAPYDLDVAALEITDVVSGQNLGRGVNENRVCFFNQKNTPALVLDKDNRTGFGEGPDETIVVDLNKVDPSTQAIPFVVTIYDAINRQQTFDQLPAKSAKAVLIDNNTGEELVEADLTGLCFDATGSIFVSLIREPSGWSFKLENKGFVGKQIADFLQLWGFDA